MSVFADPAIDLAPAEVAARLAAGELELVDVREAYEWEAGHVPGSRHLEIERVGWQAETIDRERPVAFICRLGTRAGLVAQAFRAVGYDAYNVEGGFSAWFAGGLPREPEDATVAPH
jgi:rhodanese-related sulfurtransferase